MKRILAVLLLLGVFLSGCVSPRTQETTPPQTQTTIPTETTETQTEPPLPSLMDQAEPVGTQENLFYLPNPEIEAMWPEAMVFFQDSLLLWSQDIRSTGSTTLLKRVSLEDGTLLGAKSFPSSGFVTVQTGENAIGICDAAMGSLYLLDSSLNITNTYSFEESYDTWYLNRDLDTLYVLSWETGIRAITLETGETQVVLDQVTDLYIRNETEDYVIVTYTDLATQMTTCRLLNLQTGLVEPLPVDTDITCANYFGDTWLIGDSFRWGKYALITGTETKYAFWQDNRFELLEQGHLLAVDVNGGSASLYDPDGTFVSRCALPENDPGFFGRNMLWSDTYGGYFLLALGSEPAARLLFWDVSAPMTGEPLPLTVKTEKTYDGADPALYQRAEALSQRFGVEIRIADQCRLDYGLFVSTEVDRTEDISYALDVLEDALSQYPEGFLEQLKYGSIQNVQFELVGLLKATDDSLYSGTYAGFTREEGNCNLVVLDIYEICDSHIYHELTHIIDRKLSFDAAIREDALFSEETWNTYLPQGFAYAETYLDLSPDAYWDYVFQGYFVSDYACRYATEDRATMMEMAMTGSSGLFGQDSPLARKLSYYSACIRDCFRSDTWEETTLWEKVLIP